MVSIDTLLSKVKRDGLTVDEATAVEWIAEALDFIGVVTQYEQAVAFIEVKDYQAPIPQGLTHFQQGLYQLLLLKKVEWVFRMSHHLLRIQIVDTLLDSLWIVQEQQKL